MTDSEAFKTELAAIQTSFEQWRAILEEDRAPEHAAHLISSFTNEQKVQVNEKQIKDIRKIKTKSLPEAEELILLAEQGSSNIVIAMHIVRETLRRCDENNEQGLEWGRETWKKFLEE